MVPLVAILKPLVQQPVISGTTGKPIWGQAVERKGKEWQSAWAGRGERRCSGRERLDPSNAIMCQDPISSLLTLLSFDQKNRWHLSKHISGSGGLPQGKGL